jgi:hypothetical protein
VPQGDIMKEFDARLKAAMSAGDGIGDLTSMREKQQTAFKNDFCPWLNTNKSRMPADVINSTQFNNLVNNYCTF